MGTIYISDNKGAGDFKCDGSKDQVEINKAFEQQADSGEALYFEGDTTYIIDSPVLTTNKFELTGGEGAVLKLADNVSWAKDIPMIKQKSASVKSDVDINIHGFAIDGNYAGNSSLPRGKSYHTLMWFYYGDVKVSDMTLQNGHNDGLKALYADVTFENNKVSMLGHEAVYAIKCKSLLSQNNVVRTKTNSGTRAQDTNNVKILNNEIYTQFEEDAGGPGIQVQFSKSSSCPAVNNVEIANNNIHDCYGPGIWLVAYGGSQYSEDEACGVVIHDNEIRGCGTHKTYNWLAGIITSGFYGTVIRDNIIADNYGAGILIKNGCNLSPNGKGNYTTIVKDNQISGNIKMKCGIGGQGIRNEVSSVHKVTSEGNYIWDNAEGPYFNVTGKDFLYAPPENPEEPVKPAYLAFEATEHEITALRNAYPKRTILRRVD